MTPSGVPQNELKSLAVSRLPNSFSCTEEGNHSEPHRMSHDLAHSTRLPKRPGYNLKWQRVTPIQVTLVIGPPAKAMHLDPHPKLCRNHHHEPTLHPKSPGVPLASPGGTWFQTAWRASHTAKRQAPFSTLVALLSLGRTNPVVRHHAHTMATATILGLDRLAAHPAPLGAILVAQC